MNEKSKKYIAIIPARGGSKRIPKKNLILLNGVPLIKYSIDAARASSKLTQIFLSTDEQEIFDYATKELNLEIPYLRPQEIAGDRSPVIDALKNVMEFYQYDRFDAVVLLQPTSPFRTGQDIDLAIDLFEKEDADTVTSVCAAKDHPYYFWTLKGKELKPFFSLKHQAIIRQNLPPALIENGAIYIIKSSLIKKGKIYGQKIIPYLMDSEKSIDIDNYSDLKYAEFMIKNKEERL